MTVYLSSVFGAGAQLFTSQGVVNAGGKIYTYVAGSTTPVATYTDATGLVQNANPIILDSAGRPTGMIWIQGGTSIKMVVTDATGNNQGPTLDNITGVGDNTQSFVQWISSGFTPAYVSATSFTTAGDSTGTFQVGRRVKSQNTSGFVYSTVAASSFSSGTTTITLFNDSTTLDSGLSSVQVGLLTSLNGSSPITQPWRPAFGASTSAAVTGTTSLSNFATYTSIFDTVSKFNATTGIYTVPVTGIYQLNASVVSTNTGATSQSIFIINSGALGNLGGYNTPNPGISGTVYVGAMTAIAKLTQGDTVFVRTTPGNTGYSAICAFFSGSLIG